MEEVAGKDWVSDIEISNRKIWDLREALPLYKAVKDHISKRKILRARRHLRLRGTLIPRWVGLPGVALVNR
jgi:hypothetical protein